MWYFQSKKYPIEFVVSENMEKHFDSHNHVGHYVISLIVCGRVEVQKRDQRIEYFKDDIFIVPPYVSHGIYQEKDSRLLSLCIGTAFIEKYPLPVAEKIIRKAVKNLSEPDNTGDVSQRLPTADMIGTVQRVKILQAVSMIYDFHAKEKVTFQSDIAALTDRIITRPEGKLRLEDLARAAYISKYYMIRKFKNMVGMTPHQFQIQNRVRQAQRLLDKGSTITEAAAQMGFYDQSHFNKCFLKIVGISPMEYVGSRIDF